MELSVHIPKNAFFTLFAKGWVESHVTVPEKGTFIRFEGVVLLYYKYPHHRRAYIVRNAEELRHYRAVALPNVKQPVGIILKAKGRRIDILRNAAWNLQQINGTRVFKYDTVFWQKVGCLIENYRGRKSAAVKSNLILLSREYERERNFPVMAEPPV
jgi:hypothetical protein